ncbi:MAG: helix-turn-helix domain-containing protein [Allosphingosinicella sp.]|uniref:helix-turn-helix domain-containing protein n=1 Tax=Allosphingosinicella sp. TaxID=2823234 RepID=UPI00395436F9
MRHQWIGSFGKLHVQLFEDPLIRASTTRLWDEAANGSPEEALFGDSAIETIILALLSISGERIDGGRARGGLAPRQVRHVMRYLDERLAEDVTLSDLATLTGLSTFHLCRTVKKSTGLPPHRWRHQRRIERARELQEDTNLPITEMAAAVGYDDPSQLAAAFRKALGVSPSKYRRERLS